MARRTPPQEWVAPIDLLAQYDLQEEIGGGPRARVYRARDRVLDHVVAIKLLHDRLGGDPAFAARLYHTARAAASLGHPNIVAVYDHGPHDGSAFITSEWIAGANLAALLGRDGAFQPRYALPIIARVLDALSAAHAHGIAHGDLHPRNILVREGTTDGVVLTDFGMGLAADGEAPEQATPYRAPEIGAGEPASVAGDLYAVGVILFELLTGQLPRADGPNRRPPAVPRLLFATIGQALAADPAKRYPSAAALRAALVERGGTSLPAVWVAAPEGPLEAAVRVAPPPARAPFALGPRRTAALLVAGTLALGGLAGAATLLDADRAGVAPAPTAESDAPTEPKPEAIAPTPDGAQGLATAPTPTSPPATPVATIAPASLLAPAPIAGTVPQAAPPSAAPRPTPTTGTPRVVAGGGIVGVSLENFSPALLQGAYQPLDARNRAGAQVALHGMDSAHSTGTLAFEVASLPTGQLVLILSGLDDEWPGQNTIQIVLNSTIAYTGPVAFTNRPPAAVGTGSAPTWDQMRIVLPAGTLRPGPNILTLRNLSPGGDPTGPYILISNVEFASEAP